MAYVETCGNCGSKHITVDALGETTCCTCGAPLCSSCNQVLHAYEKEDGTVGRRHERDLKAPRCPVHKAELVQARRGSMYLIRGGAA